MSEPELSPCPFCGSQPELKDHGKIGTWIECCECLAEPFVHTPTKAEAIAGWNTRAAPPKPAPDALREALNILNNLLKFADDNATIKDGDEETWAAHARHLRDAIARLSSAPVQSDGEAPSPQVNADLQALAELFAESVHETYTREQVVSVIEDVMKLRAGAPADGGGAQ